VYNCTTELAVSVVQWC